MGKPKISWNVPRWAYVPGIWREWCELLRWQSLLRIGFATALVAAVILIGLKWALPQIVLPKPVLLRVPLVLPMMYLVISVQCALLALLRPSVTVRRDRIHCSHGQSALIIKADQLQAIYLTFHTEDRIRLQICYTNRSQRRVCKIGIPPTVDLDRLTELLPRRPVVRDARNRSIALARGDLPRFARSA